MCGCHGSVARPWTGRPVQSAGTHAPDLLGPDHPALLEDLQVLDDGRQADVQRLGPGVQDAIHLKVKRL